MNSRAICSMAFRRQATNQVQKAVTMKKSGLLRALQAEISGHTFDCFVDEPPSVAQGGKSVVTLGCPACRKRLFTVQNVMDHLTQDVLPPLVDRLSTKRDVSALLDDILYTCC